MSAKTRGSAAASTPDQAPEMEVVDRWRVSCDGGEGALGHPRVWLQISEELGWVECGYCDKRYVHESATQAGEPVQPADSHPEIP